MRIADENPDRNGLPPAWRWFLCFTINSKHNDSANTAEQI
jgi:hypothetical protein